MPHVAWQASNSEDPRQSPLWRLGELRQPTHLTPRKSKAGNELPIAGIVIDSDMSIDLVNAESMSFVLGGLEIEVTDGVRDDAWHVVVIKRSNRRTKSTAANFARLKALQLLGVRQCLSGSIAKFDRFGYASRMQDEQLIDLTGLEATGASLTASSCSRLLTGLSNAANAGELTVASEAVDAFMVRQSEHERSAANALKMCFAAIDVLPQNDPGDESWTRRAVERALLSALDSVSLLATCTCAGGNQ